MAASVDVEKGVIMSASCPRVEVLYPTRAGYPIEAVPKRAKREVNKLLILTCIVARIPRSDGKAGQEYK